MLRFFGFLVAFSCATTTVSAQVHALPSDTAAIVTAALRYARHELINSNRHVSIDLAGIERAHAWSDLQATAFQAALAEGGAPPTSMERCDSRRRSCRLDATSEVVSVGTPQQRGDTVTIVVQVTRLNPNARMPYSLRGHEYSLVKRNAHWVVVRSELVLVS
jgi:hypothetical protein